MLENGSYFHNTSLSLSDILGKPYTHAACSAYAKLSGRSETDLKAIADKKIEFYPIQFQNRLKELIPFIGKKIVETSYFTSSSGAASNSFNTASHIMQAPLSGMGYLKVTESGSVQAITKSEHYHAPLGHNFPGYQLIQNAQAIGISNITHNNTRGHITRLLESELIAIANSGQENDRKISRVINLQTGSLAVEAGVKMMLNRFYKSDPVIKTPVPYAGKIPVFLVMADYEMGKQANYHGTTILTQTMRGLWPELYQKFESAEAYKVVPVPINDFNAFKKIVATYDAEQYKIAGFIHELILMNYGGIAISKEFLQSAYELCDKHDIPTLVDEIQSCLWAPDMFLYKEYGLNPDFVSVGKGFPGGQFASSKILLSEKMDNLSQFGALVTNGQEELASLAYLITIQFVKQNREITRNIGDYYEAKLHNLAEKHKNIIIKREGNRHLGALIFESAEKAATFAQVINAKGFDISAQTYKANCPPAALTKIPLIADVNLIDALVTCMDEVLSNSLI